MSAYMNPDCRLHNELKLWGVKNPYYYLLHVRQKSLLRVTISTKRNLLPPCERGRLEKGTLLSLIILHFTPLLSPPLLLPLLKIQCCIAISCLACHVVDTGVYVTCATSVNPQFLKYHMKWPHILHRCSSQYALWLHCWKNQECLQDTVRLYPL